MTRGEDRVHEAESVSRNTGGVGSVRILGSVDVVRGGEVAAVSSAGHRRLLTVLAAGSGRVIRAEWLADTLGVSPGALQTRLSGLRGLVGAETIVTETIGYRLGARSDAAQFEDLISDTDTDTGHRLERLDEASRAVARTGSR